MLEMRRTNIYEFILSKEGQNRKGKWGKKAFCPLLHKIKSQSLRLPIHKNRPQHNKKLESNWLGTCISHRATLLAFLRSLLALRESTINVAKTTAVSKKSMKSCAWAAIWQKYASIVGSTQIYLLYRKPAHSKGLPTASSIYHCKENTLIFTTVVLYFKHRQHILQDTLH